MLFFLPDALAAVRRWLELLAGGGRIGLTTFAEQDQVWQAVDDLFDPYLPAWMLDPRTVGRRGPFSSETALAALVSEAGGEVTASVEEPVPVRFADVGQWERFSLSTGQPQMWQHVPRPSGRCSGRPPNVCSRRLGWPPAGPSCSARPSATPGSAGPTTRSDRTV